MAEMAIGDDVINKLHNTGILPKDLKIRRVVIDIQIDHFVKIYYETVADKITLNFCLDELIKHKDQLTVKRVVQKLDDSV